MSQLALRQITFYFKKPLNQSLKRKKSSDDTLLDPPLWVSRIIWMAFYDSVFQLFEL